MKKNNFYPIIACAMALALSLSGCKKEDENAISMDELDNGVIKIPCANGQTIEVVDLGIPFGTLWAKCNLGATSPEQYGTFFAWGETTPKDEYTDKNYAFNDPEKKKKLNKYIPIKDEVNYDGKNLLEPQDDAATVLLGDDWHIPTIKDFQDMLDCTEKTWCKLNGVWGFKFTSTRKGFENNSIFISAAGCIDFDSHLFEEEYGFYWSSTIDMRDYNCAKILWLDNQNGQNVTVQNSIKDRYNGLPIRPVTIVKQE
ncbi:MAG: hypothetical protein IKS24_07945 [Bacteroidaceae bacterium]|nr:hypothetical protein [Bacteroidaceae bacterium]